MSVWTLLLLTNCSDVMSKNPHVNPLGDSPVSLVGNALSVPGAEHWEESLVPALSPSVAADLINHIRSTLLEVRIISVTGEPDAIESHGEVSPLTSVDVFPV